MVTTRNHAAEKVEPALRRSNDSADPQSNQDITRVQANTPRQTPIEVEPSNDSETHSHSVEASVMGTDQPMEREHPKAPGALIWFSYPLVLLAVLAIAAIAFTLFG